MGVVSHILAQVTTLSTHGIRDLLRPLRNSNKHSSLQISPTDLTAFSVLIVIGLFVCRRVEQLFGLGTAYVSVVLTPDAARKEGSEAVDHDQESLFFLPDSSLTVPFRFDSSHKSMFTDAVKASSDASVRLEDNNALMAVDLGALTETAMLLLLCKQACPVSPLGAVKVRIRFELVDPILCRSLLSQEHDSRTTRTADGQVQSEVLLYASYPRPARKVKGGIEIDVEVAVTMQFGPQKSSRGAGMIVYRQEMTILQFKRWKRDQRSCKPGRSSPTMSDTDANAKSTSSSLLPDTTLVVRQDEPYNTKPFFTTDLSVQAPHCWARLCKDYNPIHVLPWAVRLFALPGVIAHGNHAVAACVWAMTCTDRAGPCETALSDPGHAAKEQMRQLVARKLKDNESGGQKSWWMEVKFKSMLFLPATFGPASVSHEGTRLNIVDAKTTKVGIEVSVGRA